MDYKDFKLRYYGTLMRSNISLERAYMQYRSGVKQAEEELGTANELSNSTLPWSGIPLLPWYAYISSGTVAQ